MYSVQNVCEYADGEIRKEVEEKNILPETKAGFRKGRGTMDNIYVLNHIIQKEIRKKGGKIFGFFMDLKSAFDKVDRKILWEEMERRGIRKGIVERIKKIYESTKNVVRVNGRVSERFSDGKRSKTGLPAKSNPVLAADSRYRRRNEKRSSRGSTGGWREDLVVGIRR